MLFTLSFVLSMLFSFVVSISNTPFFRKDYVYLERQKSFYKIHTIHRTWQDAKKRCAMEGAKFYYPQDADEVHDVITFWNNTQSFHWIYVGISDLLSKGSYETFDGIPVVDIYSNWAQGEPNDINGEEDCVTLRRDSELNDTPCGHKYPFACKKTLSTLEWNNLCDMPDSRYLYTGDTGKCYKIHVSPLSWLDAHAHCYAEQSYLTVINSKKEVDHLIKLIQTTSKPKLPANALAESVHIGFHNRDDEGWRTIKGTTLGESGYVNWDANQPNGNNKCGSMTFDGKLKNVDCNSKSIFICEHDISILASSLEERIALPH